MNKKLNILLIEDNRADSELIKIYLSSAFFGTCTISVGGTLAKGMEMARKNVFDVILADLSLPDSAGLETFSKLYSEIHTTPIIVLTGLEDDAIGIEAVKMGAQEFLIKGKVNGNALKRSINYSIERHKLLRDISTKTKALEETTAALLVEKHKLAEAQKIAHIGSWEWDMVAKKVSWSNEFYRIHGLQPGEIIPTTDKMLCCLYPEDRPYVSGIIESMMKSRKPTAFSYRIVRKDGEVRTLYSQGEIVLNEQGIPVKLICTGQDITERTQQEEMQKLAIAATQSYNSVVITDEHGNIEWVNDGFTALTGYTLEDVKGTHGEILRRGNKTGISEETEYFKTVLKLKESITYESKNYTKTGNEYWTVTTLTPVLGKNGEVKHIIAIDSDITIRKRMEEDLVRANKIAEHSLNKSSKALDELVKAKKELEESMRIKERFLANMSHEIRTPMNAIVGFTDLLVKTQLSAEQKQYINAIKVSGENLLVIINDILDFSKIQSGKLSFEQIEFRLSQSLAMAVELMLPLAIEKNIKLSKFIDEKIPDRLIGDPTRLNQALVNLMGNAIKFTVKGEVKVNADMVSENEDSVTIKFSVSDTGIGIPKDKLPTIFGAFTQATYDTTRKYGGTGLGLAIVKQLVELQGGTIAVTSEVKKGSVFTFTLQYKKNLTTHPTEDSSKEEKYSHSIKELSVLLAEDNTLNQILAKKVLTDWGWKVDVAENGLAVIEKLGKEKYDIILMDLQMPEMDGYETTRHIRNNLQPPKSNMPIMAMTAHAISGEEEKCLKAGMNGYISKPFNPEKLYAKIASVINIKGNGAHIPESHSAADAKITEIPEQHNGAHKHTNLTYLKTLAKGSNEFIRQMLTLFIEQTPDVISKMEKYIQEHNWESLSKVAHKMKPSVMFVGIKEIEKDVKLVEQYAANADHIDLLPGMVDKIKEVCTVAITELKEEMQRIH